MRKRSMRATRPARVLTGVEPAHARVIPEYIRQPVGSAEGGVSSGPAATDRRTQEKGETDRERQAADNGYVKLERALVTRSVEAM